MTLAEVLADERDPFGVVELTGPRPEVIARRRPGAPLSRCLAWPRNTPSFLRHEQPLRMLGHIGAGSWPCVSAKATR